ncbi:MAG: PP2C family protein-serine/threonine phosphatase [Bacteroidia bacterium]|nr:serine/threonine-protein phosphatase [Bacteroidia bacterium]MDW8157402.1 PP2C family protein-serine/threonine phosphatase [Bacteroidia bacterium]
MATRFNAYNTTNPEELLLLKKQEAAALLQVVRSISLTLEPEELINLVCITSINQLGINKLILVTYLEEQFAIQFHHGFDYCNVEELKSLRTIGQLTKISNPSEFNLPAIGIEYVIPLGNPQAPGGWFLIADFADSEAEAENDLIFIETIGNILIISLYNIHYFHAKLKERDLLLELEVAGRLQKQALPSNFNINSRLDIYAVNVAHHKVAGDFYDLLTLNPNEIVFCIGDVSGKGIPAALLVANIQANIRALFNAETPLHRIIRQLHQAIYSVSTDEEFVTLFIGKLNLRKENIVYINAGHNPIFLIRKEGIIKELSKGCIPLGLLPIREIELGTEKFYPGDSLFLYTDGVVEEMNANGELLGSEVIKQLLLEKRTYTSQQIILDVLQLVWKHAQSYNKSYSLSDDVSMMMIKFLK